MIPLRESDKITDVMTSPVVTVEMDDSLKSVKNIFDHTHFHHLLVVSSGKLIGLISDRDFLKAISPNIGKPAESQSDSATLNKRVHQIMTRKPIALSQDAEIMDAVDVFNRVNISCLPIIDDTGKPIGILSWRDILRVLSHESR